MWKNPSWFLWMVLAFMAASLSYWLAGKRRSKAAKLLGTPSTMIRILPGGLARRRQIKLLLDLTALAFIFIALAGPQWGVELVQNESKTRQILIAVDTSLSMAAQDAQPSRLEAAKMDVRLLLDELSGNRIGLMVFSGNPDLICPMTMDGDALRQAADTLTPDMLPDPGTAIGKAIREASEILKPYPGTKSLILLSDGGDHDSDPGDAAKEAGALGIQIYALGFGSLEGSPIPIKDASGRLTGYKTDRKDGTVVTRLHENVLTNLGAQTRGAYFRAGPDQSEVSAVVKQILQANQSQKIASPATRYRNHYRWPLTAAFWILLIEFLISETDDDAPSTETKTKPISTSSFFGAILILSFALPARAATAEGDLREGNTLYQEQKYLNALDKYSDAAGKEPSDMRPIFNSGDALFRLDDAGQAAKAFAAIGAAAQIPPRIRSAAYYNLGDVDFSNGDYQKAVADFRSAVTLNPRDPQARYNLAVALNALKNPPPKNKKKNNGPKPQSQKNRDKNNQPRGGGGGGQNNPNSQPRPSPQNQMSKEDAERIMRAVAEREKPAVNHARRARSSQNSAPQKDW
ncbi:MAG: vWA domain-containing protein [Elusimicrobiota bacterium]